MGIPETANSISVDEYLAGEQLSEIRHEYIGGRVYAMSGGSEAHNVLSGNLYAALRAHFKGKPCEVFDQVDSDRSFFRTIHQGFARPVGPFRIIREKVDKNVGIHQSHRN